MPSPGLVLKTIGGFLLCPLPLDADHVEKQMQVKADFLWDLFFVVVVFFVFCQMQMITKSLGIISQNTHNGTDSQLAHPPSRAPGGPPRLGTPACKSSAGVVYFRIPAETVPSAQSCCAWKPSVQTSGFPLALIPTYVVLSNGTLPTEFSQQP